MTVMQLVCHLSHRAYAAAGQRFKWEVSPPKDHAEIELRIV